MLELRDLHSFYGRSHVIQGISMRVDRGEGVGLIGHNGVGKTTTLKSIMGTGPRISLLFRFLMDAGKSHLSLPGVRIANIIGCAPLTVGDLRPF